MKPPYCLPTMEEIRAIPQNAYHVVSTFSGCGGSSLGYRMAGFRILWASEFVKAAQETYRANFPETILDTRDIRIVTAQEILSRLTLQPGELDLLDGSPPCASFSSAGKGAELWGKVKPYSDVKQRTDDLFFEFIRLLRGLRPKVFVAENVPGLLVGKAKGYFLNILHELKHSGYRVVCRLLDAQWLGVPQVRRRVIFIGVRNDIEKDPVHPKPLPYRYTLRDILPTTSDPRGQEWKMIIGTCLDAEWDKLRQGERSTKYFNCRKPDLDKPCPTILANDGPVGTASVVHPFEKRKFSIRELKLICGFPDDFQLPEGEGSAHLKFTRQWERMGRAVPPVMMSHIARTIRDEVLNKP